MICIGCGCTDEYACPGGCSWQRVKYFAGRGVCTKCPDHELRFLKGDDSLSDRALEAVATREAAMLAEMAAESRQSYAAALSVSQTAMVLLASVDVAQALNRAPAGPRRELLEAARPLWEYAIKLLRRPEDSNQTTSGSHVDEGE
jgi:hypothetical protein